MHRLLCVMYEVTIPVVLQKVKQINAICKDLCRYYLKLMERIHMNPLDHMRQVQTHLQ